MRTNSKEVRQKIQAHIIEHYEGDTMPPIELLKHDVKAVKYGQMNDYNAGIAIVDGGIFLCCHSDVKDFLNGLGINPNNKEYDNQKSWELYRHLLAREIEKMVQEN